MTMDRLLAERNDQVVKSEINPNAPRIPWISTSIYSVRPYTYHSPRTNL